VGCARYPWRHSRKSPRNPARYRALGFRTWVRLPRALARPPRRRKAGHPSGTAVPARRRVCADEGRGSDQLRPAGGRAGRRGRRADGRPRDLLVRVHVTSVTRTDCGIRGAKPFFIRGFTGVVRPKAAILGGEFAGVVESIGPTSRPTRSGRASSASAKTSGPTPGSCGSPRTDPSRRSRAT
jgi:Alcohol dehydrogenase GroES-like domain